MYSILMLQKREITEKTGGGCGKEDYSIRKVGQGAAPSPGSLWIYTSNLNLEGTVRGPKGRGDSEI